MAIHSVYQISWKTVLIRRVNVSIHILHILSSESTVLKFRFLGRVCGAWTKFFRLYLDYTVHALSIDSILNLIFKVIKVIYHYELKKKNTLHDFFQKDFKVSFQYFIYIIGRWENSNQFEIFKITIHFITLKKIKEKFLTLAVSLWVFYENFY